MPEREPPQPVNVLRLLENFDHGSLVDVLDDDLRKIVRGAQTFNQSGSITLTINVAPGGGSKVDVTVKATSKVPRRKLDPATLHIHPDGQLHYHHHEQKQIEFEADEKRPNPTGDMS